MPANLQVLEAARVNTIMQALQDVRELPAALRFLNRTPVVPATYAENTARYIGRVQMADLVADDQRAVLYSSGKLTFETVAIPNIKHGAALTQEQLNQLLAIQARGGVQQDQTGMFAAWETRLVDGLLLGIRQRMEMLLVAMAVDGLSYDRLGIRMSGVSWGMPADLKLTLAGAYTWNNPTTALPVTDITTVLLTAAQRYGIQYNRLTMSLTAFRYMIATTEFQNAAKLYLPVTSTPAILPYQNVNFIRPLAANILGVQEIELYDQRAWSQAPDGTLASTRYWPINAVGFSDTGSDNNPLVQDFANAVVTESIVAGLVGGGLAGGVGGGRTGPIAYPTVEENLNPPQVTYWGVARGFPRKHLLQATAVLTVGTFTDTIPVGEPF